MRALDAWAMPLAGTSLIEASAGTGKTYTLTTLYLRLLVEEGLSPAQILVVTYTQAATAELRERVRERIQKAIEVGEAEDAEAAAGSAGSEAPHDEPRDEAEALRALARLAREKSRATGRPDPLRAALQSFDEAAIFTIHGFCQRTLQENAFESGLAFDAQLVEKADRLERTLAHDLAQRLLAAEDPEFVEWLLEGGGKRWQFEPEALQRNVLSELGADETMPIVPPVAASDAGSEGSAEAGFATALRAWAKAWNEGGASLAERLVGPNDLSRSKYKVATIETRWIPELDAFASQIGSRLEASPTGAGVGALTPPDCLAKLTTEALVAGLKKNGKPITHPCLAAFDELLAAAEALEGARNRRALALRRRFVDEAREAARQRREVQHLLFFDDLLSELRAGLRGPGGERLSETLREQYRFALIDEFQDTDPVQYDIFRDVWHGAGERSPGRGLVLIGDPKQAIYSFRDADVFTYLAARENAGEQVFGLPTNWRSDPGLIAAVNALFGGRENAFEIEGIDFHPVAPREDLAPAFTTPNTTPNKTPNRSSAGLRVLFADRVRANDFAEEEVAPDKPLPIRFGRTVLMNALARDVADLFDSGAEIDGRAVEPSDIAVLCRRKVELQQMKRALEAIGVPCVDRGDADVFESREAWEFLSVLQAMMRSGDPAILRGALATGAHGFDARALLDWEEDSADLAATSERFAEYGRLWKQSGFSRAFETWRRSEGVTARLLAYDDGERRLTNWLHLAELIQRVASERAPSRSSLVGWLERAIASPEAREWVGSDASLLRLERDDQAVSLLTLHRSKGLEYPIVYLPSLWEDTSQRGASAASADAGTKRNPPVRFHDASTGQRTLDLAGHDEYGAHLEQSQQETFSEQLRLLYVGLTRARHQCVLAWGAIGSAYARGPLAWLLHGIDPEARSLDRKASEGALKKWTDEAWRDAFGALAERAGTPQGFPSVEVEDAPFEARPRWQPETPNRPPLGFTPPTRTLDRPLRTTSFSGLVREGHRVFAPTSGPEVTGRDLDAHVVEGHHGAADAEDTPREPDLAADMHAFPRGPDAGTLLHSVLEETDLRRVDADEVRARAAVLLEEGGLDSAHLDQVVHVVESVAGTNLRSEPETLRLGDIADGQLRPEVEFTLVAPGAPADAGGFEPAALAELLATAERGSPLERYAERAGRLGFSTLRGYLRGYIDAVFCDGERYYLIDYKSNHLGATQADYQPDALVEPMIEHDYVLQYLVYSVALDRHLAKRLADYDYDRHFGGAYYLFLRGLAASHAPGCGVFFDRPPREIVAGASALMGWVPA